MTRETEKKVVRISTVVLFLVAAGTSLLVGPLSPAPGYALKSSLVLYMERFAVSFGVFYFLLTVGVRSVGRGDVPQNISRGGMTWPEDVTTTTLEAINHLQEQIDSLDRDIQEIASRAVLRPPSN